MILPYGGRYRARSSISRPEPFTHILMKIDFQGFTFCGGNLNKAEVKLVWKIGESGPDGRINKNRTAELHWQDGQTEWPNFTIQLNLPSIARRVNWKSEKIYYTLRVAKPYTLAGSLEVNPLAVKLFDNRLYICAQYAVIYWVGIILWYIQ